MKNIFLIGMLAAVIGCSSSSATNNVDGLYSISETRTGGTCADSTSSSMDTMVVTSNNDGTVSLQISSLTGSCDGELRNNHVTAPCTVTESGTTVTLQLSIDFTTSGLTGTAVISGKCSVELNLKGVKK